MAETKWNIYVHGISIVGRPVRIFGGYAVAENVADSKRVKLPVGLIGRCELICPTHLKLIFYCMENNNMRLWHSIEGMSVENSRAGVLVVYLNRSWLHALEVDAPFPLPQEKPSLPHVKQQGTAMGVRG